ncbi:EAL domain-containing protein [Salinarimonas soli]|uniref:Bifunctional diguanylate cyclase/phosphodiesterase n=1 Tax=Salinarimonas soli TaxID=1638099 RepID=A0A5B2VSL5_9HYPH|nr:bifunctional diguanylate cyclase/phosphodiesterase [Salinarimonas soli]KAA2241227.1 bifunctional diguanylate cyclase/phosphodiesterase [Salinarimonas soli]
MSLRGATSARKSPLGGFGSDGDRGPLDPRAILTSIGEVVYDWDLASDVISWGLNAADVLGMSDLATLSSGRAFALAVEPGSGPTRYDAIFGPKGSDGGSGVSFRARYGIRLPNGRLMMVEDTGRWYADAEGRPAFAHGVVRIDRNAADEPPAGLNDTLRERSGFITAIAPEVAEATRQRRSVTVFVAAVDDLGRINDEIGYECADAVIAEVLRRLGSVMRRRDKLSRYAGNRFAMALLACTGEQAEIAARRMAGAVESAPVMTPRGPMGVRLRIGAAAAPEHAVDAPRLLRRAEEALGALKKVPGGPSYRLYDATLAAEVRTATRGTPALDVLDALNDRRVVFARQPIVDAATRQPAFHEALVRIRNADGTLVGAGDIMGVVERSGIVPLVDTRMVELTTDWLAAHPDERLSINVSPLTLEGPDWLNALAAHLGAKPGVASRLIVEITETAAVRNVEATRGRLDALKALGVALAIDDFGSGHTSFKHLRNFPVDILKIDGAFIQNLSRSTDDRFFVRTLVDLAHHLGIATVAEWVEDEETALMLADWGIDYLQGDHCGRPAVDADGNEPRMKVA